MSIDMTQFHQIFFEESSEGLDIMESGLLSLDGGAIDPEAINTIFRAAHSIKGGSGTFGFTSVSEFTHGMEAMLDEMREGRRPVTQSAVDILLASVDCLREMLAAIQNEQAIDQAKVAQNQQALEHELQRKDEPPPSKGPVSRVLRDKPSVQKPVTDSAKSDGWRIAFCPHDDLLKTGNDPVRMFRELNELGELTVKPDLLGVPGFYELNPEECHLSWDLILRGAIERADIDDVFDWVEDECDLAIQALRRQDENIVAQQQPTAEFGLHERKDTVPSIVLIEPSSPALPAASSVSAGQAPASVKSINASSIRIDINKIDALVNSVGELVITQSMLNLIGENFNLAKMDLLKDGLEQLKRNTFELQESVMSIRMLPVSFVFSRMSRLVHDLSQRMAKKVELKLEGEHTEIDKTVIELISDPLVHLIRNCLDHGIETPTERIAAGKSETGTIMLNAYHRGGQIVIEVSDDGQGMHPDKLRAKAVEKGLISDGAQVSEQQIYELVFLPGFSTADKLTDVSGRGVGMDVVRKNIQSLGGNIAIKSEAGKGSTFSMSLPLTLAIVDGQSIKVGDETYIIPLGSIIESISVTEDMLNLIAGHGETFRLRGEYLPVIRMHEIFAVPSARALRLTEGLIVVVEGQGVRSGLLIDELLDQQQFVIKSLEANYRNIEGVSGATILGDGSVALILDIPGLIRLANQASGLGRRWQSS